MTMPPSAPQPLISPLLLSLLSLLLLSWGGCSLTSTSFG